MRLILYGSWEEAVLSLLFCSVKYWTWSVSQRAVGQTDGIQGGVGPVARWLRRQLELHISSKRNQQVADDLLGSVDEPLQLVYPTLICYACRLLMEQEMRDTSSFFCKMVLLWILWKHSHRCAFCHDAAVMVVVMVVEIFINIHTQKTESRDLFHMIPTVCVLRVRVPFPFSWKPFISSLAFPKFRKRSSSELHSGSLDRKLKLKVFPQLCLQQIL